MANNVTVRDVAQMAEVSVATVSRVLNNHANVKEEVRQRVLKTAKELGYMVQASGQNSPGNSGGLASQVKEIGFIFYSSCDSNGANGNTFWLSILHGAEREANKSGIKITYHSISELASSPEILLATINDLRLDGILLVGTADAPVLNVLQRSQLPIVLVDNYIPKASVDAVLSDNFEGAKQAVDYLIEQGHTKIAFIGGQSISSVRPTTKIFTIERRAAGYRTALLEAGLILTPDLYESGDLAPEGGYAACKRLLDKKAKFTALFCANDATAIGALKALREAQLDVPRDISVVGFDNISMAEHYHPALTTINVNKEGMGAVAVKTLLARVADPTIVNATIMLEVELVKRESVATLKK